MGLSLKYCTHTRGFSVIASFYQYGVLENHCNTMSPTPNPHIHTRKIPWSMILNAAKRAALSLSWLHKLCDQCVLILLILFRIQPGHNIETLYYHFLQLFGCNPTTFFKKRRLVSTVDENSSVQLGPAKPLEEGAHHHHLFQGNEVDTRAWTQPFIAFQAVFTNQE